MPALDLSTARWRKSSCGSDSNTCVEVAGPAVGLRDSTNADGPVLALPAASFTALKATFA